MDITRQECERLKNELRKFKIRLATCYIDVLIKEAEIWHGKRQIEKLNTLKTFLME